jgi:glycosyltransferase involved in cell wall biosynthesis
VGYKKELQTLGDVRSNMRKKIIVVGPALSQTGYGEQCRFALRALMSYDDVFDIYLKAVPWGNSSWIPFKSPDRKWIDSLIQKANLHLENGGQFDVSFQVTIPNEWEKLAPINIGYTAGIETTLVTPEWIQKSKIVDKIITISEHSKEVFLKTLWEGVNESTNERVMLKCDTPIDVVHYPVRNHQSEEVDIKLDYDFNFLTMAQWGPRKNLENTIKWWVEEFKDDEVGLVVKTNLIKTSIIDRQFTQQRLQGLLQEYKDAKCKVYLIHGNMSQGELTSLFNHPKIKCMVSLTHGEGFGLPLFEAAYNGLPIIAPDWSGHRDFLYAPKKTTKKGKTTNKIKPHFAKVAYEIKKIQKQVVWKGVLHEDSSWCYPTKESYSTRLRDVYTDYNRFNNLSQALKRHIVKNFTQEKKYKEMAESVKEICGFVSDDEIDSLFERAVEGK